MSRVIFEHVNLARREGGRSGTLAAISPTVALPTLQAQLPTSTVTLSNHCAVLGCAEPPSSASSTSHPVFRGSYENRARGALLGKARRGHCKATHHVVQINEGIVNGHHLDLPRENGCPGDQAADAAKSGER